MIPETALAHDFAPGTNQRDSAAGAGWWFLLPSLTPDRVLCLGAPPNASLTTLARMAGSVVVWCPDRRRRRELGAVVHRHAWAHVRLEPQLPPPPPAPDRGFDLICLPAGSVPPRPGGADGWVGRVPPLLAPDGHVYMELAGRRGDRTGHRLRDALARHGFGDAQPLWLTPRRGELRAAAPAGDADVRRYLIGQGLHRPESSTGLVDKLGRALGGTHPRASHRPGLLVGPSGPPDSPSPPGGGEGGPVPRFVADLAGEAGVELTGFRWGLSARGRYRSRKVLLLLFRPGDGAPEYVVKLSREPNLNHRLENERGALLRLQEDGIGTAGTYPRVEFAGYHGGLAVLGERALAGVPFDRASTGTAACPYARSAVDSLIDLAAATAARSPAGPGGPGGPGDGLSQFLDAYERIYAPGPDERACLADQVARLESAALPAVFQHGDPGTWNLLGMPGDRVAFLDWEAADPQGMPLWDLFHFFRSFGVLAARRAGTRSALDGFARQFLADTPVSRLLADSMDLYTRRVPLAADLAGPLLLTGWMYRALKEGARLRPDRLAQGHYVRLLRLCLAERRNPHFARLFPPAG
jgi:hypothetical protein